MRTPPSLACISRICLLLAMLAALVFAESAQAQAQLVQLRTVKLPTLSGVDFRQYTFNNCRGAASFRPETKKLLLRGHPSFPEWAELDVTGPTAVVSGWFDPTHGLANQLVAANPETQGFYLRSLVVTDQDETLGCISEFYNTAQKNRQPFFRGDLSLGMLSGPWNGGQHSLRLGGYLSPLSPQLRLHFRRRWAGGETSPQGTSGSNRGPSLYVFDLPERSLPPNATFSSLPVITYVDGASYPGYYPSWRINSMHCLPTKVIWVGRRGVGANWYGDGTTTLPGGAVVKDLAYPGDKGYHSERYVPTAWTCSNESLIAGAPVITETVLPDLAPGKGADLTSAWDGQLLYAVYPKADSDRPLIAVFQVQ